MTITWLDTLNTNPLPALLAWQDEALTYFVNRDLVGMQVDPVESLWVLPDAKQLVKQQQEDGSWKYAGKTYDPHTGTNYFLIETYRNLRTLIENFGYDRSCPAIIRATEYVFSCQTDNGDIRGILGNQYMPYYHGAILELLIKAGYADDPRVLRGLDWLLSIRQDDGGWIIPAQAVPPKQKTSQFWLGPALLPDRRLPHAHIATGMALRAFAAHPEFRFHPEVIQAGHVLKDRLFKADKYNDRKAKSYWLKFQFPFWWTSLVTTLDTLSRMAFDRDDPDIARGLSWFLQHQESDGLWPTGYGSGKKSEENRHWVGLAICRVFTQFDQGV